MQQIYQVGVIGCGYWGPNLIRNFMHMPRTNVSIVADLDDNRLRHMKRLYPSVTPTRDYRLILNDPTIDIVAIATPVSTHFRFASEALNAGKHVFVEKPLTSSVQEAESLIDTADENDRILMVGHTFLYTAAVKKMKEIIESGELGDIYYINAQRLNLGLFQQDINVIWDLAPHDFSVILYLLDQNPVAISATGTAHINPDIEDVATVSLFFENNIIAFVQSSWLDPDKIRRMTIVGSKKMMVYDDIQPAEKIRIYDKAVERPDYYDSYAEFAYSYKYGDIVIPQISGGEPILRELEHFIDSIEARTQPLSDGPNGLEVVKLLETANKSLALAGQKIFFDRPTD